MNGKSTEPDALEFSFRSDVSLRREKAEKKEKEKDFKRKALWSGIANRFGYIRSREAALLSWTRSGGKLVAPSSDLISASNRTI